MDNASDFMHLYRPVGLSELKLIEASGWRAFPPRLPEQPIFYPVLTYEYAELIATSWNAQEPEAGYVGFITRFNVVTDFLHQYPLQVAGGNHLQELWVPAADLPALNQNIVGQIEIVGAEFGANYAGMKKLYDDNKREPSPLYQAPKNFVQSEAAYQHWLQSRS